LLKYSVNMGWLAGTQKQGISFSSLTLVIGEKLGGGCIVGLDDTKDVSPWCG
jgi:hypothetical protein